MKRPKPYVVAAFKAGGPMTSRELARYLDKPLNIARAKVSYAKRREYLYIFDWKREAEDGMKIRALRPVYAAGCRPDAPKPPPVPHAESCRIHREKKGRKVSSVFSLGTLVGSRRLTVSRRRSYTPADTTRRTHESHT